MKKNKHTYKKQSPVTYLENKKLVINSNNQISMNRNNNIPSISSKVMFWRPRYLANSQWLQHIPFYFWLIEELKPNSIVEPNLNSAVGYFAICQAIDKLNQDCFAYASFGKLCDVKKVTTHNYDLYREFSSLSDLPEQDFINELDDASIDLLLLKHDSPMLVSETGRTELQKKLTDKAVVLIHGSKLSNVRELCKVLRSTYPSFELTQDKGLLLLCMGKQIPERLEALINQAKDVSAQRLIQNIYARLGSANEDAWLRQVYEYQLQELTAQLQQQTDSNHFQDDFQTQKQADEAEKKAKMQANELDIVKCELAKLQKEHEKHLVEKDQALIASKNQLAAANKELNKQQELNALLERDQQVAADKISQLKLIELNLQQSLNERFDELATLTNILQQKDKEFEAVVSDLKATQSLLNELSTRTVSKELKSELKAEEHAHVNAHKFTQNVALIQQSKLFDEVWYLQQHPEAADHKQGAAGHYLIKGLDASINPSINFNSDWYLNTYQDVKKSGMNPLLHYIKFGQQENRKIENISIVN